MELSAILLARTIALFETLMLNPRGAISPKEITSKLAERFSFMARPEKLEDFDGKNGIAFKGGYFEGQTIDELTIYNDGIKIDVRSSTEDGQKLILDSLEWLRDDGLISSNVRPIIRWAFLSQILVTSDLDLDGINPAFKSLTASLEKIMSERKGESLPYRLAGVSVDFPRTNAEYSIVPFLLERRAKAPDSQKQYYSQAPLQTLQHLHVLSDFEHNLKVKKLR
jgi:hypothetical protein